MSDVENNREERERMEQERHEERTLITWSAPSRPFRKHDKEYYTTIAVIVFLLSLILFFAGQFLFIAVIVSLAFVSYVLAAIPPDPITISISTFGIHVGEQMYYWQELGRFWFTNKYGSEILHVETARAFPTQLILLLGDNSRKDEIKKIMLKHAVFETPKATWLDNAAKWMTDKFPLEKQQ